MIKRLTLMLIATSVMSITGCQNEKIEQPEEGKRTHKLIVNAYPVSDTKTSVTAVSGGYQVSWDIGDQITLHECAPEAGEDDYDAIRTYDSEELTSNDILDNKASFVFSNMEDRTAPQFSYIATYGNSYAEYFDWSEEDYLYETWAETFDYSGEHLDPHMVINMNFPTEQAPLEESFDPNADLMVSDMQVMREQMTGEASFRFARLGTIVKMTLVGLDDYVGCTANEMFFTVGESFNIPRRIIYDPVLHKYVPAMNEEARSDEGSGMPSELRIMGENIVINEDGTADVWLRLPSGELTDWFRLDIVLSDGTDDYCLARFVDLAKLGKTLVFKEGGMTTFSVGGFAVADVVPVGDISWTITDAMDGFTATWDDVEHAVGYECYIKSSEDVKSEVTVKDNGDGTHSAIVENGLQADTYYIYVRAVPEDGHELVTSEFSTTDLPVGVPVAYWFSHTTFSDDSKNIEDTDEYIIPVYSPGKVRFQNLKKIYDSSWTALEATGDWFMYSTEPLKMHSIELWTKDDSRSCFKVYASSTPGAESLELAGTVIDTSVIDAGSGSYRYNHTHYLYRFTFPENGDYKYYTIKGTQPDTDPAVVMTSQYTYVYRYKMSSEE